MTRKSITTSHGVLACDVCGRTLLRGENADPFIAGGARRLVCELCTSRAANEGWIREGADDVGVRSAGGGRRRSLLARLRRHGDGAEVVRGRTTGPIRERAERARGDNGEPAEAQEPDRDPAYNGQAWAQDPAPAEWEEPSVAASPEATSDLGPDGLPPAAERPDEAEDGVEHASVPATPQQSPRERRRRWRGEGAGEPAQDERHVHAVPTNASLKLARALEVFNTSAHPRTVAGVARSLGEPIVSVHSSPTEGSIVVIVVGWELCWYRYEIDLADEAAGVRVGAQGDELDELEPHEREANAAADDRGSLVLS